MPLYEEHEGILRRGNNFHPSSGQFGRFFFDASIETSTGEGIDVRGLTPLHQLPYSLLTEIAG